MKSLKLFFLMVFGLLGGWHPAYAEDVSQRAQLYAERLKQDALVVLKAAQNRLGEADQTLQETRAIEADVSSSRDPAAIAVARDAVAEAERGVLEARQLSERAKALLARREKQLDDTRLLAALEKRMGKVHGTVFPLEGEVRMFNAQGEPVSDPLRPLQVGDRIVTGKDGSARLFLAGGNADALLEPGSEMMITEDNLDEGFRARLDRGLARIRANVQHYLKSRFEIRTPAVAIAVRGTEFSVQAFQDGTHVAVTKGMVHVTPNAAAAEAIDLKAGEEREWSMTGGWGPVTRIVPSSSQVDWGD
ncbi:MAG TPA: FecR family protein [Parasulfuritortus sp.]